MSFSFNLITEPWIPVLDQQGHCREVGLRQVLATAHEVQSVAAPTGLETASILRLLLAVLHRTHDTSSRQAWGKIWQRGRFNEVELDRYWSQWEHRFDLFDAEHPFYQQPTDRKKPTSTAGFFPGLAASDHFNHAVQTGERSLSPAEAARSLLVAQTYGLSGGCLPSERLSHKASPWVAGLIFFVEGEDLFQTLACNLLRYDEISPTLDLTSTEEDRPNWEADDAYESRTQALGYMDYLTWPSRRVWLIPETQDDRTVVQCYVDFIGAAPPAVLDPFKFYRREEKSKNATGYIPLYLNPNKAAWRSSSAILRLHQTSMRPPVSLNWLAELHQQGAIRSPRSHLIGYGLVVENQTKVILMRREAIPLPLAYLDQSSDPETRMDLLSYLDVAIRQAEQISNALNSAIFRLAETLYPRPAGKETERLSPDQRQQVNHIVSRLSSKAEYWAALERPFYQLVLDLPTADDIPSVQERWLQEVLTAGRAALAASEARAGQHPKALKAGVQARGLFEGILRKQGLSENTLQGEQREETIL